MGTGYSPPSPPSPPPPRVHLPLPPRLVRPDLMVQRSGRSKNIVVGLKSVAQLTLDWHFSGFQGITEVYNLYVAGNPNDHNVIPGTK